MKLAHALFAALSMLGVASIGAPKFAGATDAPVALQDFTPPDPCKTKCEADEKLCIEKCRLDGHCMEDCTSFAQECKNNCPSGESTAGEDATPLDDDTCCCMDEMGYGCKVPGDPGCKYSRQDASSCKQFAYGCVDDKYCGG